jgi:hypothetical protein
MHPQLTSPFLIRFQTREATTVWGWARMWTAIVVGRRVDMRRSPARDGKASRLHTLGCVERAEHRT